MVLGHGVLFAPTASHNHFDFLVGLATRICLAGERMATPAKKDVDSIER